MDNTVTCIGYIILKFIRHFKNVTLYILYQSFDEGNTSEYIQQLWTLLYLEDIVCMVYTYFKVNDFRYYTQDLILTKDKAQSDVFLCQHFNVSQMAIYIQTHQYTTRTDQ